MKLSLILGTLLTFKVFATQTLNSKTKEPSNHLYFVEGYERIKKDSLYYALLGWISPNYLSESDAWIVEGEARLGYNFSLKEKTVIIPYLGGGYLDDIKRSHQHIRNYLRHMKEHTLEYAFGSLGLSVWHFFDKTTGLGLNTKGMLGKGTIGSRIHNNQWIYGIDLGLPLNIRFGSQKRYDLTFEPFYIFLKSKHDESNYLGNRVFFGLRY